MKGNSYIKKIILSLMCLLAIGDSVLGQAQIDYSTQREAMVGPGFIINRLGENVSLLKSYENLDAVVDEDIRLKSPYLIVAVHRIPVLRAHARPRHIVPKDIDFPVIREKLRIEVLDVFREACPRPLVRHALPCVGMAPVHQ